ncbi:MAG: pectate lyase [Alphaproteobacteria bacterium]|nr:pectate lyase [Alphaproteobacteria bacterium]
MNIKTGRSMRLASLVLGVAMSAAAGEGRAETPLSDELVAAAERTLERAATYFRESVAVEGSYVWRVSSDLASRSGEAHTDAKQGWVQPPGTPAVGLAFAAAFEATGHPYYWGAALGAGLALADTQLLSGGWYPMIEFDPQRRKAWCYRRDMTKCDAKGPRHDNRDRDGTFLDDDITQSALRLLIALDVLGDHRHPVISDAAAYGLDQLLEAQYPNGAWPVRLDRRVHDTEILAKPGDKARYPETWSKTYVKLEEPEFFALNDHLMSNAIRTLLLAHRSYGDGRFLEAATRAGDFLLVAQMPDPQPGWMQTYSSAMEPIWARKFEPPSLTSWETASTIDVLIDLHRYTGLERYWDATHAAVAWLERVQIGDDLWARFYELETDEPLYMTSDYTLTYQPDDLPKHYGFQDDFDIPRTLAAYYRAVGDGGDRSSPNPTSPAEIERIVEALDEEGRWLDDDWIESATFVENVETLSRALAAASGRRIKVGRLTAPFGN